MQLQALFLQNRKKPVLTNCSCTRHSFNLLSNDFSFKSRDVTKSCGPWSSVLCSEQDIVISTMKAFSGNLESLTLPWAVSLKLWWKQSSLQCWASSKCANRLSWCMIQGHPTKSLGWRMRCLVVVVLFLTNAVTLVQSWLGLYMLGLCSEQNIHGGRKLS